MLVRSLIPDSLKPDVRSLMQRSILMSVRSLMPIVPSGINQDPGSGGFCQDPLPDSGGIYYIWAWPVKIFYFWCPAGSRVPQNFFLSFNIFYEEIFAGLKKPMYLCTRKPMHEAKVITI